jgi:hypothetical protein
LKEDQADDLFLLLLLLLRRGSSKQIISSYFFFFFLLEEDQADGLLLPLLLLLLLLLLLRRECMEMAEGSSFSSPERMKGRRELLKTSFLVWTNGLPELDKDLSVSCS